MFQQSAAGGTASTEIPHHHKYVNALPHTRGAAERCVIESLLRRRRNKTINRRIILFFIWKCSPLPPASVHRLASDEAK